MYPATESVASHPPAFPVPPASTTVFAQGDIPVLEVARYLGGAGYRPSDKTEKKIAQGINLACGIVNAEVRCKFFPVTEAGTDGRIILQGGFRVRTPACFHDVQTKLAAVVIGTLGGKLEAECRVLASAGRIFDSTLLDAVGTVMLDILGNRATADIEKVGRTYGLKRGVRFAPGIDEYPLAEQIQLFALVGGDTAGVSLNSSAIMVPSKSISFFQMLTTESSGNMGGTGKCGQCRRGSCQFRTVAAKEPGRCTDTGGKARLINITARGQERKS